jgi:hypothetical protein
MSEPPNFVRLQVLMCRADVSSLEAARCYLQDNAPLARKYLEEFSSRAKDFVVASERSELEAGCGVPSDPDQFIFICFYYAGAAALNRAFARTVESIGEKDCESTTRWLRIFRSLLDSYEAVAECTASQPGCAK